MIEKQVLLLSPQQKRAWRYGAAIARAQCAILIEGGVEPESIRDAVRTIADRHEVFATLFEQEKGSVFPHQIIQEHAAINWETTSFPKDDQTSLDDRLSELFEGRAESPLNLEKGPILEARLLQISTGRQILHLSMPVLAAGHAFLDESRAGMRTRLAKRIGSGR